jgi:hypothetical protein
VASKVLVLDADILLGPRVIVRVAILEDAVVILEVSPTSLAGIAVPTPILVHGVGIGSVEVVGASPMPYMFPVV